MIDITFTLNGTDYSALLSTYTVTMEHTTPVNVLTLDGTEHVYERNRPIINFTLIPLNDSQTASLWATLRSTPISVTYTNTYLGSDITAQMRVSSNLESAFGIKSIDGNRYYKGNTITLRQLTVI